MFSSLKAHQSVKVACLNFLFRITFADRIVKKSPHTYEMTVFLASQTLKMPYFYKQNQTIMFEMSRTTNDKKNCN